MSVNVGEIVEGTVADIMNYGAFIKLEDGKSGLVHISEVSKDYVEDIHKVLKSGDKVKAKVLSINEKGKIALSIKKAMMPFESRKEESVKEKAPLTLDDMLSKFLKDSDERQLDLKKSFESKRGSSRKRA
ncbi:MAG: S1 RNA-binding domain-containing protein [Clostridia bacterium]|nr:S1 RNA-binding domain-containing protein [Clostridia bacterium]